MLREKKLGLYPKQSESWRRYQQKIPEVRVCLVYKQVERFFLFFCEHQFLGDAKIAKNIRKNEKRLRNQ